MNTLHHKGATIAYETLGKGPPILFLHCSSASHREWLFAARGLADRFRCLLPDLMGYGETSRQFDGIGRALPCRDIDVVDAMAKLAGEPVHIVAHSYGAAVAVEFAATHPDRVRSVVAIEPVSFHLLRNDPDSPEWRTIERLAGNVIDAETIGRSRVSARHYMSFWTGRLRWLLAPRRVRRAVIDTMPKVAFEFSCLGELRSSLQNLAAFDRPTTLVSGARSPRPAQAVIEKLGHALPNCRRFVISRAGHMLPFTHRDSVLDIVERHLVAASN